MFEQNYEIIKKTVNEGFYSTKYNRKVSDDVIKLIDFIAIEKLRVRYANGDLKIC